MNNFASDSISLTGIPALIVIGLLFYLLIYLPIKLAFSLFAKVKQKNDRLRKLQEKTIIAEYEPPKGLSPAEIGFLYDSKLNISEVYGTIIHLEHTGLITFEDSSQQVIKSTKPAPENLKEFEKYILKYTAEHKDDPITLKLLSAARREGDLIIKKQLQSSGYLLTNKEQIKKSLLRLGLIGLSLFSLTILLFRPNTAESVASLLFFLVFTWPIYFVMSIFLYFTIQKIAGEPWLLSPEIKKVWPDIEGYSQYIKMVELDNLQFETENMQKEIKNKTLPYAIALGYNTGWRSMVD